MAQPAQSAARGAGNFATRKVGPLPLWAWGAIAITGILVGIWIKNRAGRSDTGNSTGSLGTVNPAVGDAAAGGGAGGGIAAPSVADQGLLAAILNSQNILGTLAETSVQSSLQLVSNVNSNSFAFAQSALDKINSGPAVVFWSPAGSPASGPAPSSTASSNPAQNSPTSGPFGDPNLSLSDPVVQSALATHHAPPGGF